MLLLFLLFIQNFGDVLLDRSILFLNDNKKYEHAFYKQIYQQDLRFQYQR